MTFTPPQGVTSNNEATLEQPHYELFLTAEGTSPSATVTLGQLRSCRSLGHRTLAQKFEPLCGTTVAFLSPWCW